MQDQAENPARRARSAKHRAQDEDLLIVWLMISVGLFPIGVMFARDTAWGAQETLGLLIVMFALRQLAEHGAPRLRAVHRLLRWRRARRAHRDQTPQEG